MGDAERALAFVSLGLWPLSEVALAVWMRARGVAGRPERRSTALLWAALCLGIGAGSYVAHYVDATALGVPHAVRWLGAAVVAIVGLAIRWTAILTLGRLFSIDVGLQHEHRLVTRGIYRWLRHPSYTGLLVCVLAVCLAQANWLAAALVLVPVVLAVAYRIRVEERALEQAFGQAFRDYRRRSWRLVPLLY